MPTETPTVTPSETPSETPDTIAFILTSSGIEIIG
jgi:hypothetical protein